MNIVSLLQAFVDDLFEAREYFYDSPDKLAQFEQMVADASHKTAARFIGELFDEMDDYLMDNLKRQERFIIQRKRDRNLTSTVGDIHYERTYCKDRVTGEYRYPLDEIIRQPKHERFTPLAEAKAIFDSTVYSYQDAANRLSIGN